jgi:hypothetical protein
MKAPVLVSLLALQALLALSCTGHTGGVRFENQTSDVVQIYDNLQEEPLITLGPMQKTSLSLLRKEYDGRVIARAPDGRILLDRALEWGELQRIGTIVIAAH